MSDSAPESNWNPEAEEGFALALTPIAKEIADFVRSKLPEGTDFGVLVLVPNRDPKAEGRVIAVTSDRRRVATAAAQWVLTVLPRKKP
jgi:hypothetical protein